VSQYLGRSEVLAGLPARIRAWIPPGCPERVTSTSLDTSASLNEALRTFEDMWRMKLDMRWRVDPGHRYGGVHLCPKAGGFQLLFSYSDRNLDCALCGFRRRGLLVGEISAALVSDELYLTLDRSLDPQVRNSMTRFIRRNDGRAVTVPGSRWRMMLSTVMPNVNETRSTIECDPTHLRDIASWVVSLWVSDEWQVSSTPSGILKAKRSSGSSGKYSKGDTFGKPGELIGHLVEVGECWQNGPITTLDRLDESDVNALLERHARGEFDHVEPYELDVLEGGTG
jgi:hypothetical protein